MAKRIAKKIKTKFKPIEIKISTQKILNHSLIEVLPLYGNETERKKADEETLKELQKTLKIVKRPKQEKKQEKPKKIVNSTIPILKPRIP